MKDTSKALAWVLVVFATGALFGGVLTSYLAPAQPTVADTAPVQQRGEKTHRHGDGMLRRMIEHLELEPKQEPRIRQILEESRNRQRKVDKQRSHQMRQIRRETVQQIRAVLKPAQVEKLDVFLTRLKKDRRERQRITQDRR